MAYYAIIMLPASRNCADRMCQSLPSAYYPLCYKAMYKSITNGACTCLCLGHLVMTCESDSAPHLLNYINIV